MEQENAMRKEQVTQQNLQEGKQVIDLNTNLNRDQALQILIRAVQVAQSKGAYTLEDAELVSKAVRLFSSKPEIT